jgi:hypothetical protein
VEPEGREKWCREMVCMVGPILSYDRIVFCGTNQDAAKHNERHMEFFYRRGDSRIALCNEGEEHCAMVV